MAKVSSGSMDGVHPYTSSEFWIDPANHFWENEWYSKESKEYLRENLVQEAWRNLDKHAKEDFLPKN